jgi:hypothetical protein
MVCFGSVGSVNAVALYGPDPPVVSVSVFKGSPFVPVLNADAAVVTGLSFAWGAGAAATMEAVARQIWRRDGSERIMGDAGEYLNDYLEKYE